MPWLASGPSEASVSEPPEPFHWRTFKLPANDPDVALYGADGVIGWELKIADLRGGFTQVGDFARGANLYDGDYRAVASSTLDVRFRRHLTLPMRAMPQDVNAIANANEVVYWCHIATQLFMAQGSIANHCVFTETSAANPALVEIPYNPGARITCLMPMVITSVDAPTRLFIGRQGLAPQIMNTDGTGVLTMNSVLQSAWGMVTSPINASVPGSATHLIYANGGLYAVSVTDDVAGTTNPPVRVQSNWADGGYAIGINGLPKGEFGLRAFWARPIADRTTPAMLPFTGAGPAPMEIIHTNLEGTDPVRLEFDLDNVYWACFWNRNLVVADANRVVIWDGETNRDAQIFNGRQTDSNLKWQVAGLAVRGGALLATVTRADLVAGQGSTLPGNTTLQVEQYEPQFSSWLTTSGDWVGAGVPGAGIYTYVAGFDRAPGVLSLLVHSPASQLPVSRQTGHLHLNFNGKRWGRMFLPPYGQNPFNLYRQTGSSQNTAQLHEFQGTATTPSFELPQLEGRWKRADSVVFMGDVDAGDDLINPDTKVTVSLNGGTPIPFLPRLTGGTQVAQTADTGDDALWMRLQLAISIQVNASMRTCNGLPILIRGRAYLTEPGTQQLGIPPALKETK